MLKPRRWLALWTAVMLFLAPLPVRAEEISPEATPEVTQEAAVETELPPEATPEITQAPTTEAPTEATEATETEVIVTPAPTDTPEAEATPENTETPEPTEEVPEDTPTAAPEVTDTVENTEAPETAEPTGTPEAAEPTETPEGMPPTETPDNTEEPVDPPTPEETETATPEPTPEETSAPEETPTAAPVTHEPAQDTEVPWDESTCDHANIHCVQAPACDLPGCAHLGKDIHGLDIPLCDLGIWLLERQDALAREGSLDASPREIDLSQGDAVIWRSGVYTVTTSTEKNGNIDIQPDRIVTINVREKGIGTLRMAEGSQVTLAAEAQVTVSALVMGTGTHVTLTGPGAGRIHAFALPSEESTFEIRVKGGSWYAQGFTEAQGLFLYGFSARGTDHASLGGEALDYTMPDADGRAYLYLPSPGEGMTYRAHTEGTELIIEAVPAVTASPEPTQSPEGEATQAPEATETPSPTEIPGLPIQIEPGTGETETPGAEETPNPEETSTVLREILCEVGKVYSLSDEGTDTVFVIDQDNVTLKGAGAIDASRIRATVPYILELAGDSEISGTLSLARVAADGIVTLSGETDRVVFLSGSFIVSHVPARYSVQSIDWTGTHVLMDGEAIPCVRLASGELLLPVPEDGREYLFSVQGDTLSVLTAGEGQVFSQQVLQDSPDLSGIRSFAIQGNGMSQMGSLKLSGGSYEVKLDGVQVFSDGAVLALSDARVTLLATGDSALTSREQVLRLDDASSLHLSVPAGRLLLQEQEITENITLSGNIKVVPEREDHRVTVLTVLSRSGQPLANTPVTVRIGTETHDWITHYDGTLSLWGYQLSAQDVVVTGGEEVYGVAVRGAQTDTEDVHITDIVLTDLSDGTLEVRFTCPEAKTAGVSFIAAQQQRDLPDTFVERAQIVYASDGVARLTGIEAGMTVTLRVFASARADIRLSPETADSFTFSEVVRHVHRAPYVLEGNLDRTYTGKTYVLPLTLPEGARAVYTGEGLENGLPKAVGRYTLKVTIPEGNAQYLPGETTAAVNITRIPLRILPAPNQEKFEGEEDPEFLWEAEGLLEGDEVTGTLLREEGEESGNYRFDLSGLEAPEWYQLVLPEEAPVFTILPDEWAWDEDMFAGFPFFFTGEVLHPVTQEIVRSDGRTLSVVLQAQDTLQIGYGNLGMPVYDTATRENEIFTPSLSWSEEHEQLLLRLRTEPEINKDKGYATDIDGNVLWGGRMLRLSWQALEYMDRIGIDAISLVNAGASLTVSVHELLSEEMQKLIREHGWTLAQTSFQAIVIPTSFLPEAVLSQRPLTDGWTMGLYAGNGSENVDITEETQSLLAALDLEPVARLMDSVGRYDAMTFGKGLEVIGSMDPASPLESSYVQPATPEETEVCDYGKLMYNHRYLLTGLHVNDTLYCINAAGKE